MSESVQGNATRLQQTGETARAQASAMADETKQATGQVAGTAAEQAKAVAGQARQQAGVAVSDLRGRVVNEADQQTRRAAGTLRQWADDLAGLAEKAQGDSPARGLASQAADGGHRAADYLEKQGVEGLVSDVQDFARRRPGVFLGGALLAGLAVGRMAKVAGKAGQASATGQQGDGTGQQATPGTAEQPALGEQTSPPLPPGPVPDAARTPQPGPAPYATQSPPVAPPPPPQVPPAAPYVPPSAGTPPGGAPGRPSPEV
ncbi:hypothetical protein [Streptomyces bullii]|uniref:Uncharacterized protein n=1 Tax=Streptomyces bullii TaxID=349910 RepID=A0ABW0UWH3_9ACTN